MSRCRVAVTGLSVVSSIGLDAQSNWKALMNGVSGVGPITRFDTEPFRTRFAAEVKNFEAEKYIDSKDLRTMDLFIQYCLGATQEALDQSGLLDSENRIDEELAPQAASIIGCGLGGLPEIEATSKTLYEKGPKRISPFFIPKLISNLSAGHASIRHNLKGPSFVTTSACASGAHAIGEAARAIRHGIVKMAVTGGAEATISPLCIGGFGAMRALSTRNDEPQKASRPFDKDRDGFVVGEGAGILILEEWEFAKKRGASILAELVGYGATADAYHLTAPTEDGSGAAEAMRLGMKDASVQPAKVSAINAHATSTGLGDIAETKAIHQVYGSDLESVRVFAPKSMIGHTLGAAGGIEAVYSIQALQNQSLPPVINLENQDADCAIPVTKEGMDWKHDYGISNSFGFGGTNVSLIFARP